MIVVTTPTGQIGSQILRKLLTANQRVRAIVRDAGKIPPEIRGKVECIQGSHGDSAVVKRAFKDANAVFWLVAPNPAAASVEAAYVDFSRPACEAFRSAGVTHVVGLSTFGRGRSQANQAGNITASLAMDDLIAGTGVNYRALASVSFMENILRQIDSIKSQGVLYSTVPCDLKMAIVATRDIAAAGATLLIDRSWSGAGDVPLIGPEDLSANQMAEIMSDVLRKAIHFEEVSDENLKSGMLARGRSEAMAQAVVDMTAAVRGGLYCNEEGSERSSTPTSFRQWCEEALKPAVLGGGRMSP